MKFLKTAKQRAKKVGGVKDLIHREVGGAEDARSQKEIHASDLTKEDPEFCPREVYLRQTLKKKRRSPWLPTALRITFDEGNVKQGLLNNKYLRDYMVGTWKSVCCDQEWWGSGRECPTICDECELQTRFEYHEPFFIDPISEAQGSIDGLVALPEEDKLRVLECKIMGDKQFRGLVAPLAEHRLRTQFYLALVARSEHPMKYEIDTSKASVLYWLRGHGVKDENGEISPFKEFVVKRDDDAVEPLFKKALQLTLARGGGPLPDQICPHQMCERAEKCPVSKECFSHGVNPS